MGENDGLDATVATGQEDDSDLQILSRNLAPKYSVQSKLGSGGMADVYLGFHNQLKRKVAIKALPRIYARDKGMVKRFLQEAESAAQLSHPNIISIFDIGEAGPLNYFIMDFIAGGSLKDRLRKAGRLDIKSACRNVIQICRALQFAHDKGVIHRDIKPDNIMFDEHDNAILTDFGIAKAKFASKMTTTGTLIGTPHYMSPEQLKGAAVDRRSDIYSLGILFYEILTGRVPFLGEDTYSVGLKHIQEPPMPPQDLNSQIPKPLADIILTMLAKTPEARFTSASQVEQAICSLIDEGDAVSKLGRGDPDISAKARHAEETWRVHTSQVESDFEAMKATLGELGPPAPEAPQPPAARSPAPQRFERRRGGRTALLAGLGLLAVVVIAVVAVVALLSGQGGSPAPRRDRGDEDNDEPSGRPATLASHFERGGLIYVEDAGTQMRVRLLDEIGAEPETFFLRNASLPDSYDFSYNAEADRFLVELRNGMLITVDRSGTGLAEVSQFVQTGSRWMASWAADGEQVVYVRFDRGQYSLWISDIDSSGAGGAADMIYDTGSRPILYPVLNPRNPEHAVFGVFDESSGRTDLYSFFADAEEPEGPLHIQGRLVGTAWSPDGRFVAYAARTVAATTIYLYDSEEHDTEVLIEDTDADSRLAFSPDGRYLAFTSALGSAYLQIYAVPIEGGEAEQLTRLGAGARALVPLGWADVQVPDEPEPEEGQWQIR